VHVLQRCAQRCAQSDTMHHVLLTPEYCNRLKMTLLAIVVFAVAAQEGSVPAVEVSTPMQFRQAIEDGAEHIVVREHMQFSESDFLVSGRLPGAPITGIQPKQSRSLTVRLLTGTRALPVLKDTVTLPARCTKKCGYASCLTNHED
jgi:hypothetical protein